MKYMGSKSRVANKIAPFLNQFCHGRHYIEPFVGGANIIDKIQGAKSRIGYDINPYLIALLSAIRDGWHPPTQISEEQYREIKANKDEYAPQLVGFVGFCCSYGGKFFDGYARDKAGLRNYAEEGKRNLTKQSAHLHGIKFEYMDYRNLTGIPKDSIIYCDPPYENVKAYCGVEKFNNNLFWDWCREKHRQGYKIFVSEYNAPNDFHVALEMSHTSSLFIDANSSNNKKTEKIFSLDKSDCNFDRLI